MRDIAEEKQANYKNNHRNYSFNLFHFSLAAPCIFLLAILLSAVPVGQRIYLVGRGGVREIIMGVLFFSTISNLSAASIASPLSFQ